VEDFFIKILNLFLKSVKNISYSLLISDCNLVFKRVQGGTRLQEGRGKKRGYRFHLQVITRKHIQESKIMSWKQG